MEYTINAIEFLLTNVFDLYIMYRFMAIFFVDRRVKKGIAIFCYIFKYILSGAVMFFAAYPIINLISATAGIFLITLCYNSKMSKRIITTIIIYMCTFVAEVIAAIYAGLSGFDIFGKSQYGDSFTLMLIEMILWFITLVIGKFKNIKKDIPVPFTFSVAIIIVPVSSVILAMLIFRQKNVDAVLASSSLICILISNLIMVYLYDSLSEIFEEKTRIEIIGREKAYYHKETELLQKNYEELRQFRHDMKNKLHVMEVMLEKGETERLYDYIDRLAKGLNNIKTHSNTGNIAIDSIINYKLTEAQDRAISVRTDIAVPQDIKINDDDIVIILGNLLDNSIDAAGRLQDNRYIGITIRYETGCAIINISNSFDNIVNIVNGKMVTRKKDRYIHGIGLKSVESVIKKYNGDMKIRHNSGGFAVDILIYV